jgi:Cu(I)/Ag(I) efflux system membrane protein CusA/SilA
MIAQIISYSAKHRAAVLTVTALACIGGWYCMRQVRLDALPDLSDTQVIVYSQWDRSPDLVESQVTYPIVNALLGTPKVKAVRGVSDFGYSYVYVIFQDGTDPWWARTRTLEYLSSVSSRLPAGARTSLGPDATGLGWVFQYALNDETGKRSLQELRSLQDWFIRSRLRSVPGVADVASLGGFNKQYQVNVDPNRLRALGIPVSRIVEAVRGGNSESSGRLLEFGGTEYMIRGRGYVKSVQDIEEIAVSASEDGTTIRVRDVASVVLGPDIRRGVADLDGRGEVVSGIVISRLGENPLDVIGAVKGRLAEIQAGLPAGVRIMPVYDRSDLINNSIHNFEWTIFEVMLTVGIVIVVFLWRAQSSIVPLVTIPVAVLISFIPFYFSGLTANIMSLAGIAIAIGALVDAAVVVAEQTHKRLEEWERDGRKADYVDVVMGAVHDVAGPCFFGLLVIGVSFLPVFALEAQEGRLFRPLALTKSLAMFVAAILVITLDPALRLTLTRFQEFKFKPLWLARMVSAFMGGRIRPEEEHPLSRFAIRVYQPACEWCLRRKWTVLAITGGLMAVTVPVFLSLGTEFMPPLDEGSLFYMPSTMPGISIGESQRLLQLTDRIIKRFPEVDHVLGKAGRADTATDPAPLSMLETVIILKPRSAWPHGGAWYSSWAPEWVKPAFRLITDDTISPDELVRQMDAAVTLPGVSNAWTMPVKGRIDMLTTGIRTPAGLKVQGDDPKQIQQIGSQIEGLLAGVKGTRTAFAERTGEGYFLDIDWKRDQLARYGLSIEQVQSVLSSAVGGENVATTIEGQARYPINVRYMRDYRSDTDALGRVLIPLPNGRAQLPLSNFADVRVVSGPAMLRDEDGLLTGYIYADIADRDLNAWLNDARSVISRNVTLPSGYTIRWSGQYEAMERVRGRLMLIIPATLALVCLLLYLNTRSVTRTMIILLAVPFSGIGAVWLVWLLGYKMSIAVWVGLLALLGVDAETGVLMLLYLELAYARARDEGRLGSLSELHDAIFEGAVKRVRPKLMTAGIMVAGLVPMLWSTGTGGDLMKRIAAPMAGGVVTSFLLELAVYPVVFALWKWNTEPSLVKLRQSGGESIQTPLDACQPSLM